MPVLFFVLFFCDVDSMFCHFCILAGNPPSTTGNKAVATLRPNWPHRYTGERVTLRCEIKAGGDKEWEYKWTRHGSKKPSYNLHLSELRISYASVSHSGLYSCIGTVKSGQRFSTAWSDPIRLTVSHTVPSSVLTVFPSWLSPRDSVTLNCEVEHPSAGWRLYWYKAVPNLSDNLLYYRYELLPGSSNGTEPKSFIVHGQTGTAGYVCRAGRGDPVYFTDYSQPEFVFSGDSHSPSLTVSPDSVQHFTSDSVSLNCEGNSTRWRVMRFTKNKYSSYLSHCATMTGSTCKLGVPWHTEAIYWCESGSGEFSNAVNITAQNRDIILLSPVRPVPEGHSVSLGCKLRRREFVYIVFFYRNDEVVQNDTRSELKISAASKSDEGFYKCQHSREVSPQSWMSVKDSRPVRSSFPVPLIVGLVCALVLLILLLLSYRLAKDLCFIRPVQSESTNQGSDDHTINQNEAQYERYCTLLHGETHLYASVRGSEDPGNDADGSQDVTYSVIELKNFGKKGNRPEPEEDHDYTEVKPGAADGLHTQPPR